MRRGRRRWMRLVAIAGIAWFLALGLWAAADAVRAQRRLESARAALTAVGQDREGLTEAGRRAGSIARLRSASTDAAAAAHVLRRSIPLRAAGVVPVLRAQRDGVRRLGEDVSDAAASAARALEVAGTIVDDGAASGALVPVERTEELRAAVADTARTLRRTSRGRRRWWGRSPRPAGATTSWPTRTPRRCRTPPTPSAP